MTPNREFIDSTVITMFVALGQLYDIGHKNYLRNKDEVIVAEISNLGDLLNSHLKSAAKQLDSSNESVEDGE